MEGKHWSIARVRVMECRTRLRTRGSIEIKMQKNIARNIFTKIDKNKIKKIHRAVSNIFYFPDNNSFFFFFCKIVFFFFEIQR